MALFWLALLCPAPARAQDPPPPPPLTSPGGAPLAHPDDDGGEQGDGPQNAASDDDSSGDQVDGGNDNDDDSSGDQVDDSNNNDDDSSGAQVDDSNDNDDDDNSSNVDDSGSSKNNGQADSPTKPNRASPHRDRGARRLNGPPPAPLSPPPEGQPSPRAEPPRSRSSRPAPQRPRRALEREPPPKLELGGWELSALMAASTAAGVFVGAVPLAVATGAAAGYFPARNLLRGLPPYPPPNTTGVSILTAAELALQTNLILAALAVGVLTPVLIAITAGLCAAGAGTLLRTWVHGGAAGAAVFAATLPALALALGGGAAVAGLLAFGASVGGYAFGPTTGATLSAAVFGVSWPLAFAGLSTAALVGAGLLGFWSVESIVSAIENEEDDYEGGGVYDELSVDRRRRTAGRVASSDAVHLDAE